MTIKEIAFHSIPQFSAFDKAYVEDAQTFGDFYNRPPLLNSFTSQLNEKQSSYKYKRDELSQVIGNQYDKLGLLNNNSKKIINQLREENTYTVITAHQPSLFTGPLYFIYKIISAIHTAKAIDKAENYKRILPVFVIGGEDHDFEEINHFYYKEHHFAWDEKSGGPVGRMSTAGIQSVIAQIRPHLQKSYYGKEMLELLEEAYDGRRSLSQATQYFVIKLFEESPLVVVSMDDKNFKKAFIPFIKEEILEEASRSYVEKTQQQLQEEGYEAQAYARHINFFYFQNELRSRIVRDEDDFLILDSDLRFTADEMEKEIEAHPERFSPNVIMRPLYQEYIFPNLAYIGGGGELAYWMERKSQFNHFDICFPILIRRHSATLVDKTIARKIDSFGWEWKEWFKNKDENISKYLSEHFEEELDFTAYQQELHKLFDDIRPHLKNIDATLDYSAEAARSDALQIIERLHTKSKRALKKQEHTQIKRIEAIRSRLFPDGNLQERRHNFLEYYELWGPNLFEMISEAFTPFDINMKMIIDP